MMRNQQRTTPAATASATAQWEERLALGLALLLLQEAGQAGVAERPARAGLT